MISLEKERKMYIVEIRYPNGSGYSYTIETSSVESAKAHAKRRLRGKSYSSIQVIPFSYYGYCEEVN